MSGHSDESKEGAGEFVLRREMGCTRDDFLRWLPGATRHAPLSLQGDCAVVELGGAKVEISFVQAAPRRIQRVTLPVLAVEFRFSGGKRGAYRDFLAYFDLYTKRGGG